MNLPKETEELFGELAKSLKYWLKTRDGQTTLTKGTIEYSILECFQHIRKLVGEKMEKEKVKISYNLLCQKDASEGLLSWFCNYMIKATYVGKPDNPEQQEIKFLKKEVLNVLEFSKVYVDKSGNPQTIKNQEEYNRKINGYISWVMTNFIKMPTKTKPIELEGGE